MKITRFIVSFLLILTIFTGIIPASATTQQGAVTASTLTVRSGPGTEYSVVGYVYEGNIVDVLGSATATTGTVWYNISYNGVVGYASSKYITLLANTDDSEFEGTFEEYLDYQGFPESYKPYLRQLHEAYPEWKFVAFHTNLEWETALANECVLERNLVVDNSTTPSSWKSTKEGAFDWVNNKYIVLNGSNFIQASDEAIAFHMDPRNFLNDQNIFQFELLTYSSSQSIEGVNAILKNTFMYNTTIENGMTYAEAFVQIGKELNVSPYLLANRVRQEQGAAGTSDLISGTYSGYQGYYNYFNVKATGSTATAVIVNGLSHAKSQGWNTRYKSLKGGAQVLAQTYILQGQDTLYLQKFDVEPQYNGLYWHQYMQALYAAKSEGNTARKAYYNMGVLSQNFTFKIPVYLNMPEEVCGEPTKTGNPNNKLSSLSVSGYTISPSFHRDTNTYSLSVGETVSSISVSASKYASTTTLTGIGTRELQYGDNKIEVIATAENGDIRIYTINVYREPGNNCVNHVDSDGLWETDDVNHWHTCSCGAEFDKAEHAGGKATCNKLAVCSYCGKEHGTSDGENHGETEILNAVEPTETTEGYTGDKHCVDCGDLLEEGTIISATGYFLEFNGDSSYTISDGYLYGITEETSADVVKSMFTQPSLVKISKNGKEISGSSFVGTGYVVYTVDSDGEVLDFVTVMVKGDTSGDGKIATADYLKARRAIADESMLSGVFFVAGDIDGNGVISTSDYLKIKRHFGGKYNLFK